jgi:hypothetical protein
LGDLISRRSPFRTSWLAALCRVGLRESLAASGKQHNINGRDADRGQERDAPAAAGAQYC